MARGTVTSLHRWPVKSMAGEEVPRLRVDRRGAAGDRAHAVFDEFKGAPRRLTAREVPRMLAWHAGYGEADPAPGELPAATLTAPDGRVWSTADDELPAALGEDLGRPVELRSDAALMPDLPDSLLVITRASHAAMRAALGGDLDARRFRTNLLVELDAAEYAEEGWAGRRLRVGDVELELLHPCERCVIPTRDPDTQRKNPEVLRWLHREHRTLFGMNARAPVPGTIHAGDRVELI
ncbi:MAG: MOSC N-terminal beta barrel domain-containing protein [Solirubrobacteraceae bacterium]